MTPYKPKCLVKTQPPPREVSYAVGLEHKPNEFGMVFGPCDEDECLEYVGTKTACIIRFNADWTEDLLWRWDAVSECWRPAARRSFYSEVSS